MLSAPSILSLGAAGIYLLVMVATACAASTAVRHRQQPWHMRGWITLTILFAILFASRIFDAEALLRDALRGYLRLEGVYSERGEWQRPVAAVVIVLAATAGFWGFIRFGRRIRGRRNIAVMSAIFSGLAMLTLVALRIVSLHPVDALLYGPFKLNWFADIGLSGVIGLAAITYVRIVRSPDRGRR